MKFKLKILFYLLRFKWNRFFKDQASIRQMHLKSLLKTLRESPFYRKFTYLPFKLENFPLINKKIFVEQFDAINTCGISLDRAFQEAQRAEESRNFAPTLNGITVGLSSGTSGNRGVFLISEDERAAWVACVLDRVIGFSFRKRKIAFFLRADSNLYNSINSSLLEFHFFDLLKPLKANIEALAVLMADIVVAQPSMLCEIAKAVKKGMEIKPGKVISVAEVLSPEDEIFLRSTFNQTIHQVYQCTEGLLASTCDRGTLHFHEDLLIIERRYVDKEQVRFHPVITDLMRRSQPIVRYELNDILVERKDCSCGSPFLAIGQIEGRSDDMLVFRNKNKEEVMLFPDFFRRAIIVSNSEIADYALSQISESVLSLYIESDLYNAFEDAASSIQAFLKSQDIEQVSVQRAADNGHKMGTKLRRIRNDIR